jgi:hypothetical protein
VVWEIALLVWIVGIPSGVLALSELVHRRKLAARAAVSRTGDPARVIRLVPRARPVETVRAAGATRPAATARQP